MQVELHVAFEEGNYVIALPCLGGTGPLIGASCTTEPSVRMCGSECLVHVSDPFCKEDNHC